MYQLGFATSRTDLYNDDTNHAIRRKADLMDYFFRIYYTDNND